MNASLKDQVAALAGLDGANNSDLVAAQDKVPGQQCIEHHTEIFHVRYIYLRRN